MLEKYARGCILCVYEPSQRVWRAEKPPTYSTRSHLAHRNQVLTHRAPFQRVKRRIAAPAWPRTPAPTAGAIAPAPPARAQPSSRHAYATGSRGIPIPRTSARGTNSVRIGTCDVRDTRVALAGDHGECGCWVRRNALPRVLLRTPRGVAASRLRAHPRVGQIRSE